MREQTTARKKKEGDERRRERRRRRGESRKSGWRGERGRGEDEGQGGTRAATSPLRSLCSFTFLDLLTSLSSTCNHSRALPPNYFSQSTPSLSLRSSNQCVWLSSVSLLSSADSALVLQWRLSRSSPTIVLDRRVSHLSLLSSSELTTNPLARRSQSASSASECSMRPPYQCSQWTDAPASSRSSDDTVGDLKKLIAAQTGTKP